MHKNGTNNIQFSTRHTTEQEKNSWKSEQCQGTGEETQKRDRLPGPARLQHYKVRSLATVRFITSRRRCGVFLYPQNQRESSGSVPLSECTNDVMSTFAQKKIPKKQARKMSKKKTTYFFLAQVMLIHMYNHLKNKTRLQEATKWFPRELLGHNVETRWLKQ